MKKINYIITTCIALSLVMAAATIGTNRTLTESIGSKVNLSVDSQEDVYGLQFEIKYNVDELQLNAINSKMDGYTFEYREKEDGVVKGLLFSMEGVALSSANNVSDLLEFDFSSKNAFNGSSTVNFNEVILAGQHGASIEVSASSFEVNTDAILPAKTNLNKNYPNPFNPSTQIEYSLSEAGMVSLVIYDLNGAEVKTLVSEAAQANSYTVAWNGDNNQGNPVASGRYILKMSAPNYTETITMTLLK